MGRNVFEKDGLSVGHDVAFCICRRFAVVGSGGVIALRQAQEAEKNSSERKTNRFSRSTQPKAVTASGIPLAIEGRVAPAQNQMIAVLISKLRK
jgi:hypothetical protein